MCGIVGYVGKRECADVLVDGLSKLEYRGYDSAGIAVFEPRGDGKYKLRTSYYRDQEDIIIGGTLIGDDWYDLIWFNGAQTERAEVTYTVVNEASQSTVYLSDNDTIICSLAPFKEYTLHVTYYDSEGNKYE